MRKKFSLILSFGLLAFTIPASAQTQLNACDLLSQGTVNQADVNAAISMAIGMSTCTANIMGANVCNVVVTQRVVNAALGQGCVVGTHSVVVSWAASTAGTYPIAGYNVFRAPSTNPTAFVQINPAMVSPTALTFTDGAVSNSATYYYAVTAVDTQGNSSAKSTAQSAAIPNS